MSTGTIEAKMLDNSAVLPTVSPTVISNRSFHPKTDRNLPENAQTPPSDHPHYFVYEERGRIF